VLLLPCGARWERGPGNDRPVPQSKLFCWPLAAHRPRAPTPTAPCVGGRVVRLDACASSPSVGRRLWPLFEVGRLVRLKNRVRAADTFGLLIDFGVSPVLTSSTAIPLHGSYQRWTSIGPNGHKQLGCEFDPWVQLGPYSTAELRDVHCRMRLTNGRDLVLDVPNINITPADYIDVFFEFQLGEE
jgi:hypothetical protein